MESRALGRGLSALIPEKSLEKSSDLPEKRPEDVAFLKTAKIKNNAQQPRTHYDSLKLDELKSSIKDKGFLQPILVRVDGDGYEVIAGERRLRAARELGLEEVPAIIKDVSLQEAFVLALVENIQREELNAIEEAQAFARLTEEYKLSREEIAKAVAKDPSTISNAMRLLSLPEYIQEAVMDQKISMGHARALLAVSNDVRQRQLFDKIIAKGLSVRELESLIKSEGHTLLRHAKREKPRNADLVSIEEELQRIVGSKVRIQAQKKRGKVIIEYYSYDDLERILKLLKK
ncbi:MAG: ParB/RepB/Spo0J family partition protein [Candidatus Omnitrophica bacterium]|nr:ParB/RepB/Spo0J family partition protein [Candidatus Omnitrophota bacterium]